MSTPHSFSYSLNLHLFLISQPLILFLFILLILSDPYSLNVLIPYSLIFSYFWISQPPHRFLCISIPYSLSSLSLSTPCSLCFFYLYSYLSAHTLSPAGWHDSSLQFPFSALLYSVHISLSLGKIIPRSRSGQVPLTWDLGPYTHSTANYPLPRQYSTVQFIHEECPKKYMATTTIQGRPRVQLPSRGTYV